MVAAIQNGTVIDHIPNNRLFEIVRLLRLEELHTSQFMIGCNLKSKKMGNKSIIKVSEKYFTDIELNQLALVAPNVSLCIIKDYEVVEKRDVTLPENIHGIAKCANPKCITNAEPMPTLFHLTDKEAGILQCHYCEKKQSIEKIKLMRSEA